MVRLDIAKKYTIFPVKFEKNSLLLAISDPTDLKTLDDLRFLLGVRLKPLLALESDIQRAIGVYYEGLDVGKAHSVNKEKMAVCLIRDGFYFGKLSGLEVNPRLITHYRP